MHNVPRLVNFKLRACARAMVRLSHGVTRVLLALVCTTACELHAQQSRSEEHTSELQSRSDLVCRLLLEKKKKITNDSKACKLGLRHFMFHGRETTYRVFAIMSGRTQSCLTDALAAVAGELTLSTGLCDIGG